jgi:catechol 2,3-dioxygenase-like lactoylglutathione lyase family enzyme
MAAPNLTHVAIHARDIDASVRFYERYCQLVESHRRVDDNVTVVWLAEKTKSIGSAGWDRTTASS